MEKKTCMINVSQGDISLHIFVCALSLPIWVNSITINMFYVVITYSGAGDTLCVKLLLDSWHVTYSEAGAPDMQALYIGRNPGIYMEHWTCNMPSQIHSHVRNAQYSVI